MSIKNFLRSRHKTFISLPMNAYQKEQLAALQMIRKYLICEMFLCDAAEQAGFAGNPDTVKRWQSFREERKRYTWPDRPVLFEILERFFMDKGCDSPLMYIHKSPGLLRIKKNREKN